MLTDTSHDMKVVQEEIFGPVVRRRPVQRPRRASPRAANDTDYGLARRRLDPRHRQGARLARRLRAGTVWINCYNVFDAALPFGGYKESGWGREMGHEVFNNYMETKSVITDLS